MAWRDVLTIAYYPPVAVLTVFGVLLLTARVNYSRQIAVAARTSLFPSLLRRRRRMRFWAAAGWSALQLFLIAVTLGWVAAVVLGAAGDWPFAVGLVTAIVAIDLFVEGLLFAARPQASRWARSGTRELSAALAQVHWARRARIATQVYWYTAARVLEPLALWLVGAAVVIRFAATTDVRSWESQAGAVIGMVAALMMLSLSASIPTRLMPAAAAISVLAEIDHAMRGRTPRMQVVGVEGDPMNWYRPGLRQACTHLEREARRLDRTMHGGQHPVGSVLRASAQRLQHFLSSETSLAGRPPADIQTSSQRSRDGAGRAPQRRALPPTGDRRGCVRWPRPAQVRQATVIHRPGAGPSR